MNSFVKTQIYKNTLKTHLYVISFIAVIFLLFYIFSEILGIDIKKMTMMAFAFSFIPILISVFAHERIILSFSKVKGPISREDDEYLYDIVKSISERFKLPVPKIYIIEADYMNAFAIGLTQSKSSVAFTSKLIKTLDKEELEGVVAHEVAHIYNYDSRLMTIVALLSGLVVTMIEYVWIFADYFGGEDNEVEEMWWVNVLSILSVIIAYIFIQLITFAISRKREFIADAYAAGITKKPNALASALEKISVNSQVKGLRSGMAHLYITSPVDRKKAMKTFYKLLSTHPPVEERIEALRNM